MTLGSRADFIANLDRAKRQELLLVAIWGPISILGLVALLYIPGLLHISSKSIRTTVLLIPLLLWWLLSLIFIAQSTKKRVRSLNLLCPHCSKPLAGRMGQIVIATGNCCHCGAKVLD